MHDTYDNSMTPVDDGQELGVDIAISSTPQNSKYIITPTHGDEVIVQSLMVYRVLCMLSLADTVLEYKLHRGEEVLFPLLNATFRPHLQKVVCH